MQVLYIAALLCAFFSPLVMGDAWDSQNAPSNMGQMKYSWNELPLNATLKNVPWSDTYWPSYESGIAHRWNIDNSEDFNYTTYTKAQLLSLSEDVIKTLSPAEKYDIYAGRYDYPTVHAEWSRTSPQDATWEGLCHGWAPAAYSYKQPNHVTLKNKDGISIPFGSSDVKALLTFYLGEYADSFETTFAGRRCNRDLEANPQYETSPECADINAGAFHVLVTNILGLQQNSFVIDRDRSIQVWNQPVAGYSFTVTGTREPSQGSASGTVKEMGISAKISWVAEVVPQWSAYNPLIRNVAYRYWVELDENQNVIGGSYDSWDRTDFTWFEQVADFSGYYTDVTEIYKASIGGDSVTAKRAAIAKEAEARSLTVLNTAQGVFSSAKDVDTGLYTENHRAAWLITPPSGSNGIIINFKAFSTERFHDKVHIFEYNASTHEKGALIAVLHGSGPKHIHSNSIHVKSSAAYVTFTTDRENNDKGFEAHYQSHM